jgi:hypothetical protein
MNKIYGLLVIIVLVFSACGNGQSRRGRNNTVENKEESGQSPVSPSGNNTSIRDTTPVNINIYIENSSSMNGYVNGNTEFKSAIGRLLVDIKYHYEAERLHLYYINADIHPVNEEISSFVAALSPKTLAIGNRTNTNLNNIFQKILDKTDSATISILISDCIYSIKGTNTTDLLGREKNIIKDAFMTKSKNSGLNLATGIIQLHSKFNGTYYDNGNKRTELTDKLRPYYICITGDAVLLSDFDKKIRYAELEGYKNSVYLSAKNYSSSIKYTVLKKTKRKGSFKPVEAPEGGYFSGIHKPASEGRNSEFRFAVALNLGGLPVSDDILNDTANYMVTRGNFKIENIYNCNHDDFESIDRTDEVIKYTIKNMSHIIEFRATEKAISSMSFAMKKAVTLPEWIENSNTVDDSEIKNDADEQTLGKTFGIKYMIEGIADAYGEIFRKNHPDKAIDKYFEIEIPVTHE